MKRVGHGEADTGVADGGEERPLVNPHVSSMRVSCSPWQMPARLAGQQAPWGSDDEDAVWHRGPND